MRSATMSAPTRSGTGHPTGRAPGRRRALSAALTVTALTLAACGGSARSSMRPLVDEGPDAASAMVETPTTARPPSVTAKIDTSSTSAPPRQSRTEPGEASSGSGGDVGAGGSEEGVGDLVTPDTPAPTAGGGTAGGGEGGDTTTTTAATTTSTTFPAGTVVIKVRATTDLGVILVDGENHTLYASMADVNDEGTCHGACTGQWVPIAGDKVAAGEGVVPTLIGAITRADTIVQLTYGGHPLYRLNNEPIGEVMGQGDANTWFVLDAASGAFVVS